MHAMYLSEASPSILSKIISDQNAAGTLQELSWKVAPSHCDSSTTGDIAIDLFAASPHDNLAITVKAVILIGTPSLQDHIAHQTRFL
mmetsp:Transcript_32625/g.64245  ORF Transcript_32625/g.64245 Transcript_32625/m.64245 type:complete len:87 (+) Transcript_32625:83-343(+)